MPYSNMPRSMWDKMDRCVQSRMQKEGITKQQAIPACYDSIMGKPMHRKDDMSSSRKRRKQEALNKQTESPAEVIDIDEVDEEVEAQEIEQKDMLIGEPLMPMGTFGATTFDDLETARETAMEAQMVKMRAEDLQSIIYNIFNDENITDKAAAVQQAAEDFKARMEDMPKHKSNPLMDLISKFKAKMTRSSINDLPDSDFAYIEPGGKKDESGKTVPRSLRHFPIHDEAHARNALARAPQSPFGDKAMPKIRAAAKKFGIKISGKDTPLYIFKDKNGDWRWLGVFSNNYEDRSREIITEAAHKEFIEFLDAHPEQAPLFAPWHTLEAARKNRADFWDYVDGFMVIGGKLEENEAQVLFKVAEKNVLGMSHGFFPMFYDPQDKNAITKYRSFEVSDLPLTNADNPWTGISILQKEDSMGFKKAKREYLVGLIGEDTVKGLEENLKQGKSILQLLGVPSKETGPNKTEVTEETVEDAEVGTEETENEPVAELAKAMSEYLGLPQLSETIEKMDKTIQDQGNLIVAQAKEIKQLKKSKDEEIAEAIAPRGLYWLRSKNKRPSQSESTIVEKEDELDEEEQKEKPEEKSSDGSWLKEALIVQHPQP